MKNYNCKCFSTIKPTVISLRIPNRRTNFVERREWRLKIVTSIFCRQAFEIQNLTVCNLNWFHFQWRHSFLILLHFEIKSELIGSSGSFNDKPYILLLFWFRTLHKYKISKGSHISNLPALVAQCEISRCNEKYEHIL